MRSEGLAEGRLLFLIGAVQFVNVLDFMMVMPLGPDFAKALDVPTSALGLVGGSYTAAAAVSGIVGALFLDRFDRRRALATTLLGLVLATAAGGLAVDLPTLLLARIAAGIFGGPASALSLAIIADAVPVARRGRAMGAVMGAFSAASVLGVPAGLELARLGGWQLPFFAVAALGLVIVIAAIVGMPPMTDHLKLAAAQTGGRSDRGLAALGFLLRPTVLLALLGTALTVFGNFAMIPNLASFFQLNLGYPRERLGLLYLVGGAITFVTMRVAGALSDRIGPAGTATLGCTLFSGVLYVGFIAPQQLLPVIVVFVSYMTTSTFRMIPMQALASRVPHERERARYMSAQSAIQHIASALGAMLSARILSTDASGALIGMEWVAWMSLATTMAVPLLLYRVQARVNAPTTQPA